MAASWETIAFTFRTLSTRHQQNANIYLVFQIFILLAPLCKSGLKIISPPSPPLDQHTHTIEQGSTHLTIWF